MVKSVPEMASGQVDPGVVVLGLAARLVRVLVAIREELDAACVEGRLHRGAAGALAPLLAKDVTAVRLQVLGLGTVGELHALGGAAVVERELLAAVPVRVVEAGSAPAAAPLVVVVPHDLGPGLGVTGAVDLVHGKGLARGVVLQAVVGADAGLAAKLLGGVLVRLGRAVVGLGGSDLQAHALVEEEVPVVPEVPGQVGLEAIHLVEGDHVALVEARIPGPGILLGDGGPGQQEREGQR
jgi:hypothetical protein